MPMKSAFRMCGGKFHQVIAIAKADLQHAPRHATEQGIEVNGLRG